MKIKKYVRAITIVSALFFLPAIISAEDSARHVRTKVEVLQLVPRTLNSYFTYVGHLEPLKKVNISSEIAGIVEVLNVEQGTKVSQTDILVQIDTERQLINQQLNKSNYDLALKDFNRESKLLEKKLSTPAKVSALKNNLEVNRLKLQLAELDLKRSRIKAPLNGIISQTSVEIGEYVRVGTGLLEILDLSSVIGIINIPERDIPYIRIGQNVVITADAFPKETFAGTIKSTGLEADRQSRSFEIEILIPNPETQLLPGMLIRARLLKLRLENQILIPRHTIQEGEEGSFVYTVNDNSTIKRNIVLGISIDEEIQVLSGLHSGDYLVETGQQLIAPNEIVEVISQKKTTLKTDDWKFLTLFASVVAPVLKTHFQQPPSRVVTKPFITT